MHVRYPIWLRTVETPGAYAFAILFGLECGTRAVVATVIPLQAYALLGDVQRVSVLYFLVSLSGLGASFFVPWLVRRIARRRVYTLGALLLALAAVLLGLSSVAALAAGLALRIFGVSCMTVCLSLYILDHIPRRELTRSEPLRIVFAGVAWTLGPAMGTLLWTRVAHWLPFALSLALALLTLAVFWLLRVRETTVIGPPRRGLPPGPLSNLVRYFRQPRLRLAWGLAVVRSSWWVMFFVYTPIFAVASGLGEEMGGLLVSLGNALLFLAPAWAWVGRRYGLRRLLIGGYVGTGLCTVLVGLVTGSPWFAVAWLLAASLGAVAIDAAGNVPFLRAVRAHERPEMTQVFSTYRDVSELVPPGLFALLLLVFKLPVVFIATGLGVAVLARYAAYIPRRM